jgi:plastocyanin
MRTRKLLVGLVAAVAAMALPAASSAKTKAVFMGTPPSVAKQFTDQGADVNDFFPHGITVHVGDTVAFAPVGFHTADFVPKGGTALDALTPTGQKVSGSKDAAGQPFWFNGLDVFGFNPLLLASKYGKTVSYSGAKRVDSGLPLGNKLKPMKVKFTRKGSFTYYCDIHPGMKGTVKVVGKKAKAPSVKADVKVIQNQVKADLGIAKSLPKKTPPANTVNVGSAGPKGVEFFGFVPGTVNVHVGDTVSFRMTKSSFETHTATTGPGDPNTEPNSYLGVLAASFQGNPAPEAIYPSDPPGSDAATLTPTLHGNGFWNSGALDTAAATPPPGSNSVTFGAAGTYQFYCLIHPFMHGTVNVR